MTRRPVTFFALATLTPLPLLGLAAVLGGAWVWAALAYMSLLAGLADALMARPAPDAPEDASFPAADALSVLLALAHFGLLALAVRAVSGHAGLSTPEQIGTFFAFGLFFGEVSNSNAHELIHRSRKPLFRLGMWVYISLLFGHHTSAHRHVHHRFVATPDDPNSPRPGEGFYRFAPRAWIGSFRAGLRAERALGRQRVYGLYLGGAVLALALAGLAYGITGLLAYLALAGYATMQLLLSDYVQHYGLNRGRRPNGKYLPVTAAHSWNAPHRFSSHLMLNAPRHSDHHAHPARPYPALHLSGPETMPTLPHSLPVMAMIALVPPLWRRKMNRRAAKWRHAAQV
ncbi:alkane 1-monooxygenase [Actibacterium sp.]|uniref:alkane 1-monooxygenase n=1 Tax=Actibacterium sp. TaxID=1872125 RepID=UPI003561D610